jgi:hypothetical protein
MRPHTNPIDIQYHHFREAVQLTEEDKHPACLYEGKEQVKWRTFIATKPKPFLQGIPDTWGFQRPAMVSSLSIAGQLAG